MYNFPHTISLLYIVTKKQTGSLGYAQEEFEALSQSWRSV